MENGLGRPASRGCRGLLIALLFASLVGNAYFLLGGGRTTFVYWPTIAASRRAGYSFDTATKNASQRAEACRPYDEAWDRALARYLPPLFELNASFTTQRFVELLEQRRTSPLDGALSCLVAVYGGKVYVFGPNAATAHMHGWLTGMLENLQEAAWHVALPDAFFELGTRDWAVMPREQRAPSHLMLAVNTNDDSLDVPVPGGQINEDYDRVTQEMAAQAAQRPWRSRQPRAVWRGTLMCSNWAECLTRCPRLVIRWAAHKHPKEMDVRFSHHSTGDLQNCSLTAGEPLLSLDAAAPDKRLTLEQQMAYRFIIASDGHTYASGLKHFLRTGSTVLRQRTRYLEFFDAALIPWVHYVPFDCPSDTDCDIVSLVQRSRYDAALESSMETIAKEGTTFAATHLSPGGRACYWASLLMAVQPLFSGQPRLPASVMQEGTDIALRFSGAARRLGASSQHGEHGDSNLVHARAHEGVTSFA
jgi:hypothetical protein